VLERAQPPLLRLLGIAAAGLLAVVLPAVATSSPGGSVASLQQQQADLASQSRSATLDLYALDSKLTAAQAHLSALQAESAKLRASRASLVQELRSARRGAHVSEAQLEQQVIRLYEQDEPTPIDIFFGASSLGDAATQLDNLKRVASLNERLLTELHVARARLTDAARSLKARAAALDADTRAAAATEASLEQARNDKASYISGLAQRQQLTAGQISSAEAAASAAATRSQSLAPVPSVSVPAPAPAPAVSLGGPSAGGRTMVVSATAYYLPGHTATGLPVGIGVVAVDPRVIPLGTRMIVPGYGPAVAADVGSAVIGATIDLWFPSIALCDQWGRRTVTITLE
jgi:3D (Asp-Asp-Asp) domain-containing protein/peptidoglycan hydrolase CwlO-like protein